MGGDKGKRLTGSRVLSAILNKVVREDPRSQNVSQGLSEARKGAFQAEAMVLSRDFAWQIWGPTRRPVWLELREPGAGVPEHGSP